MCRGIYTKDRVGYATYAFQIDSPLNNLDPNITLGLFTWDELATDQYHRDWDIEFSRWGIPNSGANTQYVVQPYSAPGNMIRFLMSPAAPTTHTVTWWANQVFFGSAASSYTSPGPETSSSGPTRVAKRRFRIWVIHGCTSIYIWEPVATRKSRRTARS